MSGSVEGTRAPTHLLRVECFRGAGSRPSALVLGLAHTVLAHRLSSPVTGHLGGLVGKWPAVCISAEEDTFTQHLPYAIGRALPGC